MNKAFAPTKQKIGAFHQRQVNDDISARIAKFDTAEIGPTLKTMQELDAAGIKLPDLDEMRAYRHGRVVEQLNTRGIGGILLFDPLNIRYTSDSMNMQVWTMHNLARALFVSADGYMALWDFSHCEHLTSHLPLIKEVRTGAGAFYFEHGDKENEQAAKFAAEVVDLMRAHGCDQRLAVDRMDAPVGFALQTAGIELLAGQGLMEHARLIKGAAELDAMRCSVWACEQSVAAMHRELRAGLAEVELWSAMHAENIARGGEWMETRILNSGPRTNPWMQEAGPRIIQDGELLAFDTDMVGLYGYCCDMSRTWLIGDGEGSAEQKECYQVGYDHVMENMELLAPGVSFASLTYDGHQMPEEYWPQKYCVKMHGVGLCDEYPSIYYSDHYIKGAVDYDLQPGMTLCVEVYAGKVGGKDGVKLENQVLITEDGHENLTVYPYEERLLNSAG
ncbi:MAG: Xaa-Pro peptidase family protein [Pseudomonadota bacterium]